MNPELILAQRRRDAENSELTEVGFRADLLVEDEVCVELKAVEKLIPVHSKQVLPYLKLLDDRVGLLINFGAPLIRDGIVRLMNSHSLCASAPLREKKSL